ncbi:hypothetical protein HYDPIDRAFT_115115 [Hydnomerulius pinastri MD-312]|uniref:Unplaced genomic scaffold scaffold_24, whole genome shotgun sequence n=1 Tax=Hydnomerulius pinastri MD-312 TaxID=994086 RepID=A0A0C9WCB8_9AGAM|nr:hypothetical protein HYDPIDRAFT_115115 [Hydnomerulius pinastri MD-312]
MLFAESSLLLLPVLLFRLLDCVCLTLLRLVLRVLSWDKLKFCPSLPPQVRYASASTQHLHNLHRANLPIIKWMQTILADYHHLVTF